MYISFSVDFTFKVSKNRLDRVRSIYGARLLIFDLQSLFGVLMPGGVFSMRSRPLPGNRDNLTEVFEGVPVNSKYS